MRQGLGPSVTSFPATKGDADAERVSRGLGALVAEKLAAEGCNVALNYNESKERAEALAKKITEAYQVEVIVLQGVRKPPFRESGVDDS